jgi:hypothetical protein
LSTGSQTLRLGSRRTGINRPRNIRQSMADARHAKRKKRKPDFRRIRPSKTYSVAQIANALDRNVATVNAWLRAGLPNLDGRRPVLVLGSALKAWLKFKWDGRKHTCEPDELFCFRCRRPQKPKVGSVQIMPRNMKTVSIIADCMTCGSRMSKAGSRARIAEIEDAFRTLSPQKQRLSVSDNPGVRSIFDVAPQTGGGTHRSKTPPKTF